MRRFDHLGLVLVFGVTVWGCSSPTNPLRFRDVTFTHVRTIGQAGTGNGQFTGVDGICIDPDAGLFVVDVQNRRVQHFALDGTFLSTWPAVGSMDGTNADEPGSMGIDRRQGHLFLSYRLIHKIIVYDRDGYPIQEWGGQGSGVGKFSQPLGIVVDDSGYVYVADYGNSRIQKFTNGGVFVTAWGGTTVPPDYHLYGPSGLALDGRGQLYVVDGMHDQIAVYRTDGTFVRAIGESGTGEGQFRGPIGLAVDANGWLYVTDTELARTQVFDEDGNYLTTWACGGTGGSGSLRGITVSEQGTVFVAEFQKCQVGVYALLPGLRKGA
jgi:DNA-binding beta-propeller fold protein YncE